MEGIILHTLLDLTYWVQCICGAVFAYLVLESPRKGRWLQEKAPLRILLLMAFFFGIHMSLSLLTLRFRFLAGVGTWLAYLGGVCLYAAIMLRYDVRARIVNGAAVSSIIITAFEFSAIFSRFLGQLIEMPGIHHLGLAIQITVSLVLVVVGWHMGRRRIHRYYVSAHGALLNFAACAASAVCVMVYDLCAVHVFPRGGDSGINGMMSVILLALFVVDIVCYYMICHLCQEYTSRINLSAENQMNKSAAALMALTEENLAELHRIRHDIQNQYVYMRTLLNMGDLEGMKQYFEELTSTFAEPLGAVEDFGNHAMNLIFSMEKAKARKQSVELQIKAAVPHSMPFSDLDLVKLYTNLIDNAVEACAAEKAGVPEVAVNINVVGEYLFTQIKNPTVKSPGFLSGGVNTTKKDARDHGKGMGIVKGIIRKYDGSIRYTIQEGHFIVEFMLCLKEAENE